MSGVNLLLDTNILIYLLKGNKKIETLINNKIWHISIITELELHTLGQTPATRKKVESVIDSCNVINITTSIKNSVIDLRNKHKIKLPDAIIAATAKCFEIPLITADKGFSKFEEIDILLVEI
jgi:predicted nucleic acid-binding protein